MAKYGDGSKFESSVIGGPHRGHHRVTGVTSPHLRNL
jgi:hypothetical protein